MSDASQTCTARLNVADAKTSKSDILGTYSATSDVHTNESWSWDVSRTQTECQVCTQYPEIAWSVQQLCQKYWPTCYEDLQIRRLEGGSFNRIFALTFHPSTKPRPSVLSSPLNRQPMQKLSVCQEDNPSGDYILRVSRGWGPDGEIEDQVNLLSYVRLRTDIPIPRILAYDTGSDNNLGLPYALHTRIPGVPLNSIIASLTFDQRLDLVHATAGIIKELQKIKSPVAGKIRFPKSSGDTSEFSKDNLNNGDAGATNTSLEEKLAVMVTNVRESSQYRKAKPTTNNAENLQVLHFDLISEDSYNGTANILESANGVYTCCFLLQLPIYTPNAPRTADQQDELRGNR